MIFQECKFNDIASLKICFETCTFPCRVGEQTPKWYKFDDGEVSECKMDDDEEMKNQCFGGEYLGEVFDHMLKRYQTCIFKLRNYDLPNNVEY